MGASSLGCIRKAAADRSGTDSLFSRLASADVNADGMLNVGLLRDVLDGMDLGLALGDVEVLVRAMGLVNNDGRVRWLDFLAMLDRTGWGQASCSQCALPDIRPLRAAALRSAVGAEELRERLTSMSSRSQIEAFLRDHLRLGVVAATAWADAWQLHGTSRLLLLLPLGEVAPTEATRQAWYTRCTNAIVAHREELDESFTVWRADMLLTEAQFRMVCGDVLGAELSETDIDDLGLLASPEDGADDFVDGAAVLRLAQGSR